jgi:hypothetical protein
MRALNVILALLVAALAVVAAEPAGVVDVGSRRELFVERPDGTPIPCFALADCPKLIGNEIERAVTWHGGSLASIARQAVRLRFVMNDADLFALRFAPAEGGAR